MGDAKTDLLQGTLDLIVLRLLRGGPANGWDITQSIQVVSKGALEINYGSVYPALRRLEARGFVKAEWGVSDNNRRARFYELTTSGRKQLAAEREAWERFAAALGLILDGAERAGAPCGRGACPRTRQASLDRRRAGRGDALSPRARCRATHRAW